MKTTLIHNWCIGSGSHTNCFMTLLVTIFSVYNLHKYKITKILRKSEWSVFESIGYFARMRSKACLNYLQCSNTKIATWLRLRLRLLTAECGVAAAWTLPPPQPSPRDPHWSGYRAADQSQGSFLSRHHQLNTSWLKVSTKFRGDFHNIPLDIGMQYLCLFISWVYSVLNIVKICVISFTAKAARWCQATAPPRWHVMVTDPCLVPTLCWCDTLTAALHLTSHEPVGYIYIYISTYLRFYISTLDNIVPLCWTVELPITVAAAAGDVDPCDTGPALRRSQDMVWIFERPVKSASPATCTRVLHWLSATQHQVRRHWPSAGAGAAPPPATDPGSASAQGPIHTLHQGWSFRFLYKI